MVTKSGTNDIHGTVARLLQERRPVLRAQAGGRHHRAQVRLQPAAGRLHPRRPAREGQGLLLPALDYQRGRSTKQTDPARIEQRVVDYFASLGSPNENGPIERTNDARVFLGKVDWQAQPEAPR